MKKLDITGTIQPVFPGDKIPVYDYLIGSLRVPPQSVNFDMMAELSHLLLKLKKAKDSDQEHVLLENSEHKCLVRTIKSSSFRVVEPALLEYIEALSDLPDVEIKV